MVMFKVAMDREVLETVTEELKRRINPEYINDETYLGDDEDAVSLYEAMEVVLHQTSDSRYSMYVSPCQYVVVSNILDETF